SKGASCMARYGATNYETAPSAHASFVFVVHLRECSAAFFHPAAVHKDGTSAVRRDTRSVEHLPAFLPGCAPRRIPLRPPELQVLQRTLPGHPARELAGSDVVPPTHSDPHVLVGTA